MENHPDVRRLTRKLRQRFRVAGFSLGRTEYQYIATAEFLARKDGRTFVVDIGRMHPEYSVRASYINAPTDPYFRKVIPQLIGERFGESIMNYYLMAARNLDHGREEWRRDSTVFLYSEVSVHMKNGGEIVEVTICMRHFTPEELAT